MRREGEDGVLVQTRSDDGSRMSSRSSSSHEGVWKEGKGERGKARDGMEG